MFENQPKGLFALALANTGERFGYYTMLAVFALFLRANYGLSPALAGTIYSAFLMLVYFFPLIGGIMADKFGFGRMVTTGIIIMFAGYLLLSVPLGGDTVAIVVMLAALLLIGFGTGLFKGNLQVMVGDLYNDPQYKWIDPQTGLLSSYLYENGETNPLVRGSYSALNCYYLSLIDKDFAKRQYQCLKKNFKQTFPFIGIKEYHDRKCMFGFDIDAGPVIFNLSPSGTAFAIGCATTLGDYKFRKQLLVAAEIVGSTITYKGKTHYLLAKYALVGEAIILALKTTKQ